MELILDNLKQHTIISSQYVQILQQSLKEEYPDFTAIQRAQLFAEAFHDMLDDVLTPFDCHLQKHLKHTLLKQILHKDSFCINAFDVFNAYTQLEEVRKDHVTHLVTWINHYQRPPLTQEDVGALIASFKQQTEYDHLSTPPMATDCISSSQATPRKRSNFFLDTLTNAPIFLMNKYTYLLLGILCFMTIRLGALYVTTHIHESRKLSISRLSNTTINLPISLTLGTSANYMHPNLQYQDFDQKALQVWLENRNSLLASEPYFSIIIETAESFNISALLLFSITGQEQNFVPKTHQHAARIANNPFNLFGSWKAYNTSINESARIASRTLINLGRDCPKDEDQIKWINKAYAADPNWHLGVSYFFDELQTVTTLSSTSLD